MRGRDITIRKPRHKVDPIVIDPKPQPGTSWWVGLDRQTFNAQLQAEVLRMQPKLSSAYVTAKDSNGQHKEL